MQQILESPHLKILNNPSPEELRSFAQAEELKTATGAPAYLTKKVASRSASNTHYALNGDLGLSQRRLEPALQAVVEKTIPRLMETVELIQIDRILGDNPKKTWHCRFLIPKAYSKLALMWSKTLFEPTPKHKNPKTKPDLLTVDFPNWPEAFPGIEGSDTIGPRGVFVFPDTGITYILGTDYVGEVKMSFLRQAMFQMKKLGGLGLHAGSKTIKIQGKKSMENVGILLFGLSGTGKTTLTLEDHDLRSPEGVGVLQDDITWLTPQGQAYGTENNFYVKTEGVTEESQPAIYHALLDPEAVFENVALSEMGMPLFTTYTHGTNGRAIAMRNKIKNYGSTINLDAVNKVFFITRRDTVVPTVSKLTTEQASQYFMLGESIETSAGDPTKAGMPKHEAGFNPFIIGPEEQEGKRLLEILKANKNMECYLLNTGSIAKGSAKMPAGKKIPKELSSSLIREIARGSIRWEKDDFWGYEIPQEVPVIPSWKETWDPRYFYDAKTHLALCEELKKERQEFLAKFGLSLTTTTS